MNGDKELFEMMANRGGNANQLPVAAVHFIPADTAPHVLAIDKRVQQLRKHSAWIIAGAILLAFLVGVSV